MSQATTRKVYQTISELLRADIMNAAKRVNVTLDSQEVLIWVSREWNDIKRPLATEVYRKALRHYGLMYPA